MKKRKEVFSFFTLGAVKIMAFVLMLILSAGALLVTSYNDEAFIVRYADNNVFLGMGAALLYFMVCSAVVVFAQRKVKKRDKCLLVVVLGWIAVVGACLIVFGRSVPTADAMSVYSIAESLALGDTSVIHPTDSYLSYYPHQIGLVAFLEPLFRIWGFLGIEQHAYHFIKGIYVVLLCLSVYFNYKTVDMLWENSAVNTFFLCIAASNAPMIVYSSFIYGEVPAYAAFSAGMYCLLCFAKKKKFCAEAFLSILFLAFSVMLRKNSLILIIAVCLCLACEGIRQDKKIFLGIAVLCAAGAVSILPFVQRCYEKRAENTLSSGVTALSYIAMGMQEGYGACGFYNGFNFDTYQQSGLNAELANEISREAIRERFAYFKENPGYACSFYAQKHLAQWADASYDSLFVTSSNYGGRSAFFHSMYDGELKEWYVVYCKIFQIAVFTSAFLYCVIQWKKKENYGFLEYIGLVAVLGGFLFHIMWEGSSRYVYIYSLLLMPYAACGMNSIAEKCRNLINCKKVLDREGKV